MNCKRPFNRLFFQIALLSFLVAQLLHPASSSADQLNSKTNTVKIGVMSCLTGDCAEWGTNTRKGAELAIEALNKQGGILGKKVEGIFEDSHDTVPSSTVSAYKALTTNQDLHFIVGPTWTIGGMSIASLIANNENVIVVSPSVGVKEFNETSDNIFNTWPHDEEATRALAQYAVERGWKSSSIFGSQDPWVQTQSKTFDEEFLKRGGSVKATVETLPNSRELKAEALKIKNSHPDVVFFSNYQVDVIAKEFSILNFSVPKLAILMEKERVKAAHGALEGTIFALYEKPAAEFTEAFTEKFSAAPGITADTAYDAVMVMAEAAQLAGSLEIEKVKNSLNSLKDFKGASGLFSMDGKGGVNKLPVLWQVKGHDYVRVEQ